MQVLLPPGWPRPKGYSNGVAARGRQVFIAGMVGWDEHGVFAGDDFASQAEKALQNIVDARPAPCKPTTTSALQNNAICSRNGNPDSSTLSNPWSARSRCTSASLATLRLGASPRDT